MSDWKTRGQSDPLEKFKSDKKVTDPLSNWKTRDGSSLPELILSTDPKFENYKPSWLKTDIKNDDANYGWDYEGWQNGSSKVDLTPPPITTLSSPRKNMQAKPITYGMEDLLQPLKLESKTKKYTADEWDKMNFLQKIKAGIEQKKLGNYEYAPVEELYQREVDKQANSKLGSAVAGFNNALSLGGFEAGAKKQESILKDLKLNTIPNIFEVSQKINPTSYQVGKVAGYVAPSLVGAGAVKPLLKGISNPLAKQVTEGAILGSAMTGIEDAFQGKSLKETGKDIVSNAALGAGIDVLGHGIGKLAKSAFPKWNTTFQSGNTAKLETPSFKPLEVGKKEAAATKLIPDLKPKSFPGTIDNAEITSPELSRLIQKTDISYNPIKNSDTLEFAKKAIKNNYDEALNLVKSNGPATAESNTIAQLLIKKLQDEGNYTEALEVIEKVSEKATKQGQAIQALSMWGRLTPEGMLRFAQKTIDNANNKLPEHKQIKFSEGIAKDITERMKKIAEMPEGRGKTVATAEVLKTINDQVPSSLLSKISNVQTVSQLLNPKTAIRNVLGNAGFNAMENVKDIISTPLDIGLSKLTKQRTVTLPSLKTQGKGFISGLKLGYEDAVKGIDTSSIKTQFDLPNGSMFKSKFGKNVEKLLNIELKAPDRAFYQAAYDDSIRKQMKLSKILEPTEKMVENAHLDALYKTFQDENAVSRAFSNTKKALNLYKEFGLGDVVLKYPKTPANILMRAVDYSPAGYAKTVIQLAQDINARNFNQKAFVDSIGRATTGTAGLVGTGYVLNQLGIITGQSENDYDTKEVEKTVGLGDYKINVSALKRYISSGFNNKEAKAQKGDTITDYSFMQPMAIGLVIGADISQNKDNPTGSISRLTEALMTGTDTLVEQPLMQGIRRLGGQSSPSKAVMETLKGVPSSFVPSILNQVRQLTDNVSRNTYDTSLGKQSLNLVKNKIPGLSKTLEPRIDVLGKEKEVFQGKSNKPLNVFLNPAIVTKYQDKPAAQLPLDIFKVSGEKIQMPRLVDNKITHKGKTYQLTPKELTEYQKYTGKRTVDYYEYKATDKEFLGKKPEDKAKELQKILTRVNEEAKKKLLRDKGIIK